MGKTKRRGVARAGDDENGTLAVDWNTCHSNRVECRNARRWAIAILCALIGPALIAAFGFAFTAHGRSSATATLTATNQTAIEGIKTEFKTDLALIHADLREMRRDQAAHQSAMVKQVADLSAAVQTHVALDRSP